MSSARVLAAFGLAALVPGCRCRGEAKGDPVAAAVAAGVRAQLGVAPRKVTCTHDRCDVDLGGGLVIEARVKGDREVSWESEEVLRTAPIATYVRAELAALGVDATVDCGPPLVLATAATHLTCTLGHGAAWVDVMSDGGLSLELALDDETVAARTEPADPEGLDELSRALDSDEAEGVAGADPDNDPDAGADAGPGDLDAARDTAGAGTR